MTDVKILENNLKYIERLLYDVLAFTIPICGLTETSLLTTDCGENIYKIPYFIESLGVAVLTRALVMRKECAKTIWANIVPLGNNYGINYENMAVFLNSTFQYFQMKEVPMTKHFMMEMSLAYCNEILLFVHYERKDIDFNKLIKSVSKFIVETIATDKNVSEMAGELISEFADIAFCTKWITDFITKFAIPYGSREDISQHLNKFFNKSRECYFEESTCPDTPLLKIQKVKILQDSSELLKDTTAEESGFVDDLELPKLPGSSENDALGNRKSRGVLSIRVANASDESEQ